LYAYEDREKGSTKEVRERKKTGMPRQALIQVALFVN